MKYSDDPNPQRLCDEGPVRTPNIPRGLILGVVGWLLILGGAFVVSQFPEMVQALLQFP